jgi:hypothetical protein
VEVLHCSVEKLDVGRKTGTEARAAFVQTDLIHLQQLPADQGTPERQLPRESLPCRFFVERFYLVDNFHIG